MSRCFPFPPPGYEKKIRTEDADSLVKEKQKKHKKEKKDKEKRDGKEKKDKEGSRDNKYKEGKERKEKRRDKKDKEKSRSSQEDKKAFGVHPNNTVQNNGNEESKFVQDLARRINDEEEARESQSVGKSSSPCGVRENFAMEKRPENAVSSCRDQKGTEITVQPVEKKELQEKNHLRESVTKGEPKNTTLRSSQEKTEAINKSKHKYVEEGCSMLKQRDVDTRNIGKRTDHETNGFYYENGTRLNEIHRPVASPVSSVENGSKLGACQTPSKPVTELQETVCNLEHRVNGFTNAQEPKRPFSSGEVKENGEASVKKRPHSDLKYLDEILCVPKREELHEFDESEEEQEWLFGKSGVKLSRKPKKDYTTSLDETLQVWNQALRIESADTIALPYVVPF